MMRAANSAAIRSAIGLGQTDAPTFLAQSLTGQSLTGTQATSLVDLAATWNTTGNPSLIYGRVTNTNSGTTANLIDLGTFAGGSLFKVSKTGVVTPSAPAYNLPAVAIGPGGLATNGSNIYLLQSSGEHAVGVTSAGALMIGINSDALLFRDAAGILAQRNARVPQAFRVYNDYVDVNNYERAVFDYKSSLGDLIIGHEALGSGMVANRTIKFKTAGFFPLQLDTSNATFGVNILTSGFCTWLVPVSATTGAQNRSIAFELASNTALTIKVRGTDGVVRSAALILA